jgi:probable O-glycosylation ligase (exosortase A-associated)
MKQLLFMIGLELIGTVGMLFAGPIVAVVVYYFLAVARPQYLWAWTLPRVQWSNYPVGAALVGLVGQHFGLFPLGGRPKEPFLGLNANHLTFLVFASWIVVTYFMALDREVAWRWFLEYLTIFLMFIVSVIVIRTMDHAWVLYLATTVPLLYLSYHVNSLYLFDGRLDIFHRGLGGIDNNGAGLMLAMGVPLAIGAWECTRKWWRWGFVLSIPLILHAVLISYSRGAMLALLACVPVLIFRSTRRWQFLVVVVMLASLIPTLAGREIRARFFTLTDYTEDQSARSRFDSWGAAIAIANDYPIFGVGIRNANLLSYDYGADMVGRTIHSQFLQILADAGYVGLSLYLCMLLTFFYGVWRARRTLRGRADPMARQLRGMANGLEAALVVFCVGGLFLSLEVFELPYLILLQGAQIALLATRLPAPAEASTPQHEGQPAYAAYQPFSAARVGLRRTALSGEGGNSPSRQAAR